MADRPALLEGKIEVTPEMEAAGVDTYMRLLAQPEFTVDQMAREVFEAMTLAQFHSQVRKARRTTYQPVRVSV